MDSGGFFIAVFEKKGELSRAKERRQAKARAEGQREEKEVAKEKEKKPQAIGVSGSRGASMSIHHYNPLYILLFTTL